MVNIIRPDGPIYVQENEDLMAVVENLLRGKLGVPLEAIEISTHFTNAATEEYRDRNHFVIALDHSLHSKLPAARDVLKSVGIKEDDFSLTLGSLFLKVAAQPIVESMLQTIENILGESRNNGKFGAYGLWGVLQVPTTIPPKPTQVFHYKDIEQLKKVIQSGKLESTLEIDNGHGAIEIVDVYHAFESSPS